ncbi:hypothetical protein AAG906_016598 [Vitis piasezkii]
MSVVSPGDRCWFGVESKSFEDLIEETKRKVIGKICERMVRAWLCWWKGLRPAVLSQMGSFLESLGWSGQAKKPWCFHDPKESGGAQSYLFEGFNWKLKGKLHLPLLEGSLILFKFKDVVEAKRVFHSRVKWFNGNLLLKWWNPSVACLMEARDVRQVWVRVLGLPLHLWGKGLFKRLGKACGSLVAIDEDTTESRNLQWTRILARIKGKLPSSL